MPCPCLGCCILPILGMESDTSQLQMHCLTITVLAISDEQLLRDGIDILVQYFFPKKIPTQFSVCCGMLQTPPTGPKNRCCSMLRHASTVGVWPSGNITQHVMSGITAPLSRCIQPAAGEDVVWERHVVLGACAERHLGGLCRGCLSAPCGGVRGLGDFAVPNHRKNVCGGGGGGSGDIAACPAAALVAVLPEAPGVDAAPTCHKPVAETASRAQAAGRVCVAEGGGRGMGQRGQIMLGFATKPPEDPGSADLAPQLCVGVGVCVCACTCNGSNTGSSRVRRAGAH